MKKGLLIYNQYDLEKNKSFADYMITLGESMGLYIQLVTKEELLIGVDEQGLWLQYRKQLVEPDFVINRTRDAVFAYQLELMQVRVYNSHEVTRICNDKFQTHQRVASLGIPSLQTVYYERGTTSLEYMNLKYPVVIKVLNGHGGEEVYAVQDRKALEDKLEHLSQQRLLIQEMCNKQGIDVRVFVVGSQIVGAIKRQSMTDFRSNYSLGGSVTWYELNDSEREKVHIILKGIPCDCVGVDFMLNQAGEFVFNEIEDVVGCRSLYQTSDVDLAREYIEHIAKGL